MKDMMQMEDEINTTGTHEDGQEERDRTITSDENNKLAYDTQQKLNESFPVKAKTAGAGVDSSSPVELKQTKRASNYANISYQTRQLFIEEVNETKCTIKSAAKKHNINFSTAKAIMQIYRREGRIGKKQRRESRKKRVLKEETLRSEIKLQEAPRPNIEQTKQVEPTDPKVLNFWFLQYPFQLPYALPLMNPWHFQNLNTRLFG